ncbi:MAG TPA: HAD-IC family P-type ATPase [Candidatus Microsaccharimonas sp.]|jgi:Ca2+-transporting ATPase
MLYYRTSIEDTYKELGTGPKGVSRREVETRLATYGRNEIRIQGEPIWKKLAEPFLNVFMLVLFIAVVISLFHHAIFDAVIILVIMATSAVIYYVQRFTTERILRSLQKHTAQRVEVIRSGETRYIDDSELVPGDIIQLNEGDKIPADIRLVAANTLRVDEAVLTGESVPVNKITDTLESKKEVYEQTNMLFQGSFIVSGQATGIVVYTGNTTEFGRIAALSRKSSGSSTSPVQKKIDKLLSYIVMAVGGLAVGAFILAIARGIELTEAIRFVLALSVSAVPESLPVAISVILVLGMRRMAAKKALVRTMKAIETIGVITTIATDKTGTLTENKLSVQETWQPEKNLHHLPTIAHRTINHHGEHTRDPLDIAMIEFTEAEDLVQLKGEPIKKLPFNQTFSMSGNIWHHKGVYELVVKGAPEQVLDRSHLSIHDRKEAEKALQSLTSQGYRVIALAVGNLKGPVEAFEELASNHVFAFVGFLAVADTLRPTARRAITTAQLAGVTVRMITGDHFETAYHIGKQLGLIQSRDQVFDSRQIGDLTDKQLQKRVASSFVFSRVTPENKFRILQALKIKEVTAMTGDGVNDVPALSSAHVGVAMGSGSQIAKDAGDIILLNNDFESIIRAMKEGRIIFSNIRRMLFYLLSTNLGEVATAVISIAIGLPMPLSPVQILWVNLVTDTAMVIPLGLEPGEKHIMRMKPISPTAPLLSKYIIFRIVLVAVTMAALAISMYAYFTIRYGADYGHTVAFCALVVMQWANAFNARSTFQSLFTRLKVMNKPFYVGLTLSVILQIIAVFGPLQGLLGIHPIALGDLYVTSIIAFVTPILVVEIHKFWGRRFVKNPQE